MKISVSLAFFAAAFLAGCIRTEGVLQIKGKVIDERTKEPVPFKNVYVQGLVEQGDKLVPFETGQFTVDSAGCFSYRLKKIKNAYYYNFSFVGDSDYAYRTHEVSLFGLHDNSKFMVFTLNKLVEFTINIHRKSKTPACDTLILSWDSDRVDGKILYPYKIDNNGLNSESELMWIGGNVMSTVKTRVYADKKTKLWWNLVRNGRRNEINDTITCRRNISNIVNFTY